MIDGDTGKKRHERPKSDWSLPEARPGGLEVESEVTEAGGVHCLTVGEAERIIEGLREFELEEVGSKDWMAQHSALEKLNQQARAGVTSSARADAPRVRHVAGRAFDVSDARRTRRRATSRTSSSWRRS